MDAACLVLVMNDPSADGLRLRTTGVKRRSNSGGRKEKDGQDATHGTDAGTLATKNDRSEHTRQYRRERRALSEANKNPDGMSLPLTFDVCGRDTDIEYIECRGEWT